MPDLLTSRLNDLAGAVRSNWRWTQDDVNVSVLGMLLYGYATAIGQGAQLSLEAVEKALLETMTSVIGAAPK
jgi:hypothetical protein